MAPSNRELRTLYPELVTNPTIPRCDYRQAVPVVFAAGGAIAGGRINLRVHPKTRQAFRALAAVIHHHGYTFDELAGGTLSCRHIGGTRTPSLHAYGLAGDFNPSRNGYRRVFGALDEPDTSHAEGILQWSRYTDMSPAMVRDIERIRTVSGLAVWKWGGRWLNIKDPMHYEIRRRPAELATGINLATVTGWGAYVAFEGGTTSQGDDQMLDRTSPRPSSAVAEAQAALIGIGYDLGAFPPLNPGLPAGADGSFGDSTELAVESFQADWDLKVTGTIDATTLAFIFRVAEAQRGGADLTKLATKSDLANHARSPASDTTHQHNHDEGRTGPARPI